MSRIVSFMVYFLSTLSGQGEINSEYCYHSKYFPSSPAQFLPACLTRLFHITSYINKNNQPTSPIDFSVEPELVFVFGCLSRNNPKVLTLYPTVTSPWRRFKSSPVGFSLPPQPAHFRQSPIIFSPFTLPPTITSRFNIPVRLFCAQLVSPVLREALNK